MRVPVRQLFIPEITLDLGIAILQQIAAGMKFLHAQGITHRWVTRHMPPPPSHCGCWRYLFWNSTTCMFAREST
jgi:hypothetical protein